MTETACHGLDCVLCGFGFVGAARFDLNSAVNDHRGDFDAIRPRNVALHRRQIGADLPAPVKARLRGHCSSYTDVTIVRW